MTRLEKHLEKIDPRELTRVCRYLAASCAPAGRFPGCLLVDVRFEAVEFMKIHIAENRSVPNRPITHLKITTRDRYELETAMQRAADTLAEWYRSNPALGKKR